jgi:hypothetical protein
VIEVDQGHLRQAFVMLVATNCLSFGARAGNIRLSEEIESGKIWIVYSSDHKLDFDHGPRAAEIFAKLNIPSDDLVWSQTNEELKLKIGFLPVSDLATEIRSGISSTGCE